jgi:beta-mannosidase
MQHVRLHDDWSLFVARPADGMPDALPEGGIPASVPGCVHTDLLAAGLIEDPYDDRNEADVQWIGRCDWRYETTFEVSEALLDHDRVDLVCEGLDTVATVELNGAAIGTAENMHHPHRFDARPALAPGENRLAVTFESALRYAEARRDELGALPHVNAHPYNFIRKMACNFGWDWGPTLVTAGIWKPIRLEAWSEARIDAVRPLVETATEDEARVGVHVDLPRAADADATAHVELQSPGGEVVASGTAAGDAEGAPAPTDAGTLYAALEVDAPRRWWPAGHGDQPLYTVSVELTGREGEVLDRWSSRIGLRTVELRTEPDETGSAFTVAVNGEPVFCKGATWIPDDAFPTRVGRTDYRERIEQALDANMNMLRVWGGGLYESDAFYELCDELGVMVWQDFPFSCAFYPEEGRFPELVDAEARHNVARLSPHPSLVLWNGTNECIRLRDRRDELGDAWREADEDRPWGLGYYLEMLPQVVDDLDPSRPYWPGSPYSGSMDRPPNADEHGCTHVGEAGVGEAGGDSDYTHHRAHEPRFASGFGHQAPPAMATLKAALPPDQRAADAPGLLHHQKSPAGHDRLQALLGRHFRLPDAAGGGPGDGDRGNGFADWHYAAQLNQARALKTGAEWYRTRAPACQGTLYWQLNDCWPALSGAAVDGAGRRKPLWYATRRFYADRLLTIQPEGDGLVLHGINETDEDWEERLAFARLGFDGTIKHRESAPVEVPAGRTERLVRLDGGFEPEAPAEELIVADTHRRRALWFFERDRDLHYPSADFAAGFSQEGSTHRLTISTRVLLRDVCILADHLDPAATVSDQLVTLLPGETYQFTIQSERELGLDALTERPVFQCANRFRESQA